MSIVHNKNTCTNTHTTATTHTHTKTHAPLFCHRPSDRGTLWRCMPPLGQSAARRRRPAMLCERKRRRRHIASHARWLVIRCESTCGHARGRMCVAARRLWSGGRWVVRLCVCFRRSARHAISSQERTLVRRRTRSLTCACNSSLRCPGS